MQLPKLVLPIFLAVSMDTSASCMELGGEQYDYYSAEVREKNGTFPTGLLNMVEGAHFTPNVQLLKAGHRDAQPGDLKYTLRKLPNHPGALDAWSRYEIKYRSSKLFRSTPGNKRPLLTADCFFERAISMYPQHAETYKVWGIHLYRHEKYDDSIAMILKAQSMGDRGADMHYYLGLSYLANGDRPSAEFHAKEADRLGFPFKGLQRKLRMPIE